MKARSDPNERCLPPSERARLKALLAAVPEGAGGDDPAVTRLMDFGLSLRVPYWAPTHNALSYMVRDGYAGTALSALRALAACDDWGEKPTASPPAGSPA